MCSSTSRRLDINTDKEYGLQEGGFTYKLVSFPPLQAAAARLPGLPKGLNSGIVLKSYRGPLSNFRYLPQPRAFGGSGLFWQVDLVVVPWKPCAVHFAQHALGTPAQHP